MPSDRALRLATAALAALLAAACPSPSADSQDAGCIPCGASCCGPGSGCEPVSLTCQGCTYDCTGKACGDDGCWGACGSCGDGQSCSEQGQCAAVDAGRPPGRDAGTPDVGAADVGPAAFTVMDWNVENFFDETDDPATQDTVESAAEVTSKIGQLATVINPQAPDILTLEEVETKDLLRRLNLSLAKPLDNYELIPGNDPRGINVAIMSRFPLLSVISHKSDTLYTNDGQHGPYKFSRDCLEVHLAVGRHELVVLVNHQVSQIEYDNPDAPYKRLAQAQRARKIADAIRAAKPSLAMLINGDMNDNPGSDTMNAYLQDGTYVDLWGGVFSSAVYTYRESSTEYDRYDFVIPDQATAAWMTSTNIIHGTPVTTASDHSPVVVGFLFP